MQRNYYWIFILLLSILIVYFQYDNLFPNGGENNSKKSVEKIDNEVEKLLVDLSNRSNKLPVRVKKIAIGYNTNLDLVCSAIALFNHFNISIPQNFQNAEKISNFEEFASTFAHYFRRGSAAERYYDNQQEFEYIIKEIIHTTNNLNNPLQCQFRPGGNAALMANNLMKKFELKILLGGPIGRELTKLLHPSIDTLKSLQTEDDEVHLILEYKRGENWNNQLETPRSNRFIVSHDIRNSHLSAIEELHREILTYENEVLIVSGSHLLESLNEENREKRLLQLKNALISTPKNVVIHLEIAGVGDQSFLKEMVIQLFGHVDSIGLNEQELGSLYLAMGGKDFSIDDFTVPSLSLVAKSISFLLSLSYSSQAENQYRDLNRVHLHFLTYHVISLREKMNKKMYQWERSRAEQAVAAGSIATSSTACGPNNGNSVPSAEDCEIRKYDIGDRSIFNNGGEIGDLFNHFVYNGLEFWVAPVAVCKSPIRTVGLGDIISSTGLAHSF